MMEGIFFFPNELCIKYIKTNTYYYIEVKINE